MGFLPYLLIPVALYFGYKLLKDKDLDPEIKIDEDDFTVILPKFILWTGIGCVLFFGIMFVIFLFSSLKINVMLYIISIILFLSGAFTAVYSIFWKLKIKNEDIYYKNLFRQNKMFTFQDIEKVIIKEYTQFQRIMLFSEDEKLLSLESSCVGFEMFMHRLKQEEKIEYEGEYPYPEEMDD